MQSFVSYEAILMSALIVLTLIEYFSKGRVQFLGVFYAFLLFQFIVSVLVIYSYFKYRKSE